MLKKVILLFLLVGLLATMIACKPKTAAPTVSVGTPSAGGQTKSVTLFLFEEPDSLNLNYSGMWVSALLIDLLNPGLWAWDDQLEPVLEMAEQFPSKENGLISADNKTIRVPLNSQANWSDGVPVTAHDFVFTYQMIVDSNNLNTQTTWPYADYIESVTAADDKTLVIQLQEPFAAWSTTLFNFVLPQHVLEPVYKEKGSIDDAAWNRQPAVVNGAFTLREWQAGSHLVLEANPAYWRGRPKIDRIEAKVVPDDAVQMAAIKTGETDIGLFLSYADIPKIQELDTVDLIKVFSGYNEVVFFNLNPAGGAIKAGHPALQDVRVRQAIVQAIDRQGLCQKLLYGGTYPPKTKWEGMSFADPNAALLPFDPDKARLLLDQAGWVDSNQNGTRDKDGVELVLVYSTTEGREVREQTQVVVQQYLAQVGIGIEIKNYSYDTIWSSFGEDGPLATGNYDLAMWSDTPLAFPDPSEPQWLCDEIPTQDAPDGSNWYGICDAELDALIRAQEVEMDESKRIELFHQISRLLNDQVYWIGMWHDSDLWTVNHRLKNVRISGVDPFWNAYEWDVR